MSIVIWLLTFLLVLDCLVLILLVLIQLPKKEAGMGQAFGGGATDALFGSGSGNALTKMSKYAVGIFFVLTLLISVLFGKQARSGGGDLRNILTDADKLSLLAPTTKTNAAAATTANSLLISTSAPAVKKKVSADQSTETPSGQPEGVLLFHGDLLPHKLGVQLRIVSALGQQLVMSASLHDLPVIQHHDLVRVPDRR